jgi:hypothetical protein
MVYLVDIGEIKAVIEWQQNDTRQWLAESDPPTSSVQFSLRLDKSCAFFEIMIPIRYKEHPTGSAVYVRITPESMTSLKHSIKDNAPDASDLVFPSATCLDLELAKPISILIPTFINEPVVPARPRSGKILDSLSELLYTTSLRIYVPEDTLSLEQLDSISTAVSQKHLKPFTGPEFDVSRLFTGSGAKVTALPKPPPPSYNKAAVQSSIPLYNESATFDPPTNKRKRCQEPVEKSGPIWDKLRELETIMQHRASQDALVQQQQTKIVELQDKIASNEKRIFDLEAQVADLQQARDAPDGKRLLDLEAEVAGLQQAHHDANDAGAVELTEIRDDMRTLEGMIDFAHEKDDEEFKERLKEDVLEELIQRISRG